MTRILLLGAGGSAGINFTRAATKHVVVGAEVDEFALDIAETEEKVLLPPVDGRDVSFVNGILKALRIDAIHAQPDVEVSWLAANSHFLDADALLPSADALQIASDKLATAQVLGDLAPRSYNVSAGALERGLGGSAWMRLRAGAGSLGALPVRSNAAMEAWLEHWSITRGVGAEQWMLAEILTGRNLSWTGVYADGQLQASACKVRSVLMGAERSPAAISSTASRQTIIKRRDVNERCERAVQLLDPEPNGVYMVDLRENDAGVPLITEINAGRFGTTSQFWEKAKGNLVEIYLDAIGGARISKPWRDCCKEGATWHRVVDARPRITWAAALPSTRRGTVHISIEGDATGLHDGSRTVLGPTG